MTVYLTKPDGTFHMTTVDELLPLAFTPVRMAQYREQGVSKEPARGSN